MKILHRYISFLILAGLSLLYMSCATEPATIPKNLTPAEFFQKAQDASEVGNYKLAMRYYEAFKKKYPDNLEKNLWADYEIAFLYHKMNNDEKAIELFDRLIEKYEKEGNEKWPKAPRILAEKVEENILKKKPQLKKSPESKQTDQADQTKGSS